MTSKGKSGSSSLFQCVDGVGAIDIAPEWKKNAQLTDATAQAAQVQTSEHHTQTVEMNTVELQTEVPDFSHIKDNSAQLADFLNAVEPTIREQLAKNLKSKAFDDYTVDWEESKDEVKCLHSLQNKTTDGTTYPCTDVAFNSSGTILAVAYGHHNHSGWCTHGTNLCTWSLGRQINPDKPTKSIELQNCLMCIAFHPKAPSILCGGTFDGDVVVWDLNNEEEPTIMNTEAWSQSAKDRSGSRKDTLCHEEPIAKVCWVPDPRDLNNFNIASISGDGTAFMWTMKNRLQTPFAGFRVARRDIGMKPVVHGGTSLSFVKNDWNQCLVGTEDGHVYEVILQNQFFDKGGDVKTAIDRSHITKEFDTHYGPVTSVEASPYARNVFLSCSTDGSVSVRTVAKSTSLVSFQPSNKCLFAAKWSPFRPLVFAVGDSHGSLFVYDLNDSKVHPVVVLQVTDDEVTKDNYSLSSAKKDNPIYTIAFNNHPTYNNMIATGDSTGVVKVWQLNTQLTSAAVSEEEMLIAMSDVGGADAEDPNTNE
eukprot:GFYU01003986.1.p1 GENE.GFYU01003986.1~~GFYU01003986.1.p1  ORF type:complete len:534 (-),score=139.51 GFYU01003986.1:108-1709(-)